MADEKDQKVTEVENTTETKADDTGSNALVQAAQKLADKLKGNTVELKTKDKNVKKGTHHIFTAAGMIEFVDGVAERVSEAARKELKELGLIK